MQGELGSLEDEAGVRGGQVPAATASLPPRALAVTGSSAPAGVPMAVGSVGVMSPPAASSRGTSQAGGALWATRRSCPFPRGPPSSTSPSFGPAPTTLVSSPGFPDFWGPFHSWSPGPAPPLPRTQRVGQAESSQGLLALRRESKSARGTWGSAWHLGLCVA